MDVRFTLADGDEHEFPVLNPSLVAYDRTRGPRQWPPAQDAPFFWGTFLAWHAAKAHKVYDGSVDDFMERDCIDVELIDVDQEHPADPTRPAPPRD